MQFQSNVSNEPINKRVLKLPLFGLIRAIVLWLACGTDSIKVCSFGERETLVHTFCTEQYGKWKGNRSLAQDAPCHLNPNIKSAVYSSYRGLSGAVSLCGHKLVSVRMSVRQYLCVMVVLAFRLTQQYHSLDNVESSVIC